MMVLDASICVGFLVATDPFYLTTAAWLERQIDEGTRFLAPTLLLVEVAGAFARRTGRPAAGHRAITRLQAAVDIQLVPLDQGRVHSFARLAADLRLRGSDATYVAVAHESGVPLITWDDEQMSRAAEIIPAYSPITFDQSHPANHS